MRGVGCGHFAVLPDDRAGSDGGVSLSGRPINRRLGFRQTPRPGQTPRIYGPGSGLLTHAVIGPPPEGMGAYALELVVIRVLRRANDSWPCRQGGAQIAGQRAPSRPTGDPLRHRPGKSA